MRVNHDMRTPLACVQMATSLLLEDDSESFGAGGPGTRLDPAARAAVQEISGRCQLLLGASGTASLKPRASHARMNFQMPTAGVITGHH